MSAKVFRLSAKSQQNSNRKSHITLTLTRQHKGLTVITNLSNLSKEEFLLEILKDSVYREKERILHDAINND